MTGSIIVATPVRNPQKYYDYLDHLVANAALYSSSEFKIAAFCLYHTLRFNTRSASLSLRFMSGDTSSVPRGTGLGRKTIVDALRGLERKGFLKVHPQYEANGRNLPNIIEIFDPDEQLAEFVQPVDNGGES